MQKKWYLLKKKYLFYPWFLKKIESFYDKINKKNEQKILEKTIQNYQQIYNSLKDANKIIKTHVPKESTDPQSIFKNGIIYIFSKLRD